MPDSDGSSKRISLRDLAKHLGVSHATVSLALRDHPRISDQTKLRVKKAAQELGYRPDPMLSALVKYRRNKTTAGITSSIAWINAWKNPDGLRKLKEFDLYWNGARSAAEKLGYDLEEFRLADGISLPRLHQILKARSIQGILIPPQIPKPDFGNFPWHEYSVIRFGRGVPNPPSHLVTADHVANTMLAFDSIRERGYHRIGYVTNEHSSLDRGHLFEGGYLLAQRKLNPDERIPILNLTAGRNTGRYKELRSWIKLYKVEAIISDMPDLPTMLGKAGLKIPNDVAFAGTTILDSGATAGINQNSNEIGRVAMLTLHSLINDGARGVPRIFRQNLVEGTWVDGPSLPPKI